jgi:hypothetical protein
MNTYAVFFKITEEGEVVRPLGDRSVIRLDGRNSEYNQHQVAEEWASKHGFDAYSIKSGPSLLGIDLDDGEGITTPAGGNHAN